MATLRIVVTGAVGAGKTSFIRTISETDVVDTDKRATDEIANLKPRTTVAMDFGTVAFPTYDSLHLYGTPGQTRFEFMRDMLIEKAQACIVLLNATRPNDLSYTNGIIELIHRNFKIPYVIGLTHTDSKFAMVSDEILGALGLELNNNQLPVVCVNATDKVSVQNAILRLLEELQNFSA